MTLVGALIGWLTNIIAIKLMFRPIKPVIIPIVNISIQGLLPKRREEISNSIGEIIENELISYKDVFESLFSSESIDSVKKEIKKKIREAIGKKDVNIILKTFKEPIAIYIEKIIEQNGEEMVRELLRKFLLEIPEKINLSEMIENKINTFEMEHFEKMVISIVRKELRHIELLGAVLGFVIGLVQGVIIIIF